jgi:hypothetical protein
VRLKRGGARGGALSSLGDDYLGRERKGEKGDWSTGSVTVRESWKGRKGEAAMPDWCVQRRLIEGEGEG